MITLINAETQEKLETLSNNLYATVIESGFRPDLIVGIATGGMVVVDAMTRKQGVPSLAIKKQRQGTVKKEKSKVIRVLPYLPIFLNNVLRKLEVYYREYCYKSQRWSYESDLISLNPDVVKEIEKASSILVVDDTIDSGATMKCVIDSIKVHAKKSTKIKSAVLNQTFVESVVNVDYCLEERTIIRFPWAFDVKKS